MSRVHHYPFLLLLNLLRPHPQYAHQTRLLLPLSFDDDDVTLAQGILSGGEATARRCQTWGHQCGTGEDETDGATIDGDAWEAIGEGVDDAEVRDERVIHMLPEEGGVFERVEGDAVGSVL